MVRGPRRGSQAGDRRAARKLAKVEAATHGGYAGPSIVERLESQLAKACWRYFVIPKEPDPGQLRSKWSLQRGQARGEIRGLAKALSMMQNSYTYPSSVKRIEKEAMSRVKAEDPPF